MTLGTLAVAGLATLTAGLGTLGGVGGAVILVPLLVLLGMSPGAAVPIGLLSVAAGSLAAAASHLAAGTVHHRLGVTLEVTASAGATAGALAVALVAPGVLARVLGAAALLASVAGAGRRGVRNPPAPGYGPGDVGEWAGSLRGAYTTAAGVVPYRARRLPLGLVLTGLAGALAGLSGTSGGYVKTPTMSEVMHVPVKVAAATTTFIVGLTAASALVVHAAEGRVDLRLGAAAVAGGVVGGELGARLQGRLPPTLVRRALAAVLAAVGVLLLVRGAG